MTPESESFVRTFARGLKVIEAMGAGPGPMTLGEIAEQHMIGWPTQMSPAQHEERRKDAETGRAAALQLGAAD